MQEYDQTQYGGKIVGDPFDGSGIYNPFASQTLDSSAGGGGGGGTYTPPVPTNQTFVPPSAVQNDLTRALKIKLINAGGIAGEFFEDEVSKGITTSTEIVYSPSITFGNKRIYKVVSEGYVSKNYYELEIIKKYQAATTIAEPTFNFDFTIDVNPASTIFNGMSGNTYSAYNRSYYDFSYNYNRLPTTTPITAN